jgi:hypothetical protein
MAGNEKPRMTGRIHGATASDRGKRRSQNEDGAGPAAIMRRAQVNRRDPASGAPPIGAEAQSATQVVP